MASSSGGKKPPPSGGTPSYSAGSNKTLTPSQAKAGGFRPGVVDAVAKGNPIKKGSFRSPSNITRSGHKSGYHEGFGTTDTIDVLSRRKVGKGGTSKLPSASSGVWKGYAGQSFPEKNLRPVLEASDGARTDTARTILSVPGGGAAGHSGSGVNSTGQADAHDVLRHQTVRVLQDPSMTPRATAVIAGATVVFSVAPGKIANSAKDAKKLKDVGAASEYEANRNRAKRKLGVHYDGLTPAEQTSVRKHMKAFEGDFPGRKLEPGRPSTPPRDEAGPPAAFIRGGNYLAPIAKPSPMTPPPMFTSMLPVLSPMPKPIAKKPAALALGDITQDITSPFRDKRR